MKLVKDADKTSSKKPEVSDKQAEEAFKTILKWIGEDPNREGLVETPKRVIKHLRNILKVIIKMLKLIYPKRLETWRVMTIW